MKKLILAIAFLLFLLIGCGDNSKNVASKVESQNEELIQEITALDSIATELGKVKNEIQESAEKLEEDATVTPVAAVKSKTA